MTDHLDTDAIRERLEVARWYQDSPSTEPLRRLLNDIRLDAVALLAEVERLRKKNASLSVKIEELSALGMKLTDLVDALETEFATLANTQETDDD